MTVHHAERGEGRGEGTKPTVPGTINHNVMLAIKNVTKGSLTPGTTHPGAHPRGPLGPLRS